MQTAGDVMKKGLSVREMKEELERRRAERIEAQRREKDPEGYERAMKARAEYAKQLREYNPQIVIPTFEQAVAIYERETGIPANSLSQTYLATMRDVYDNLTTPEQTIGLLISSKPGTGKTTLMKAWRNLIPNRQYRFVNCLDVAEAFSKSEDGLEQFKSGRFCFDDLGNEEVKSRFGNKCDCMAEIIQFRYNRWQDACESLNRINAQLAKLQLTKEEEAFLNTPVEGGYSEERDRIFRKRQERDMMLESKEELLTKFPVTLFTTNLSPAQVQATYNRLDPRGITGLRVIDRMQQTCDWFDLNNEPSHRRRN